MSIKDREQYENRADYYCRACGLPYDGLMHCVCLGTDDEDDE